MARRGGDLTNDEARRIALAAQGFADPVPTGRVDRRHGQRVVGRVGVIQIDSVNVVCRAQELALFARLGQHRRDLIPAMTSAGDVFEYWAHEASHVPVRLQPLLRWRMADARAGEGTWNAVAAIGREQPDLVESVLDQVTRRGPLTIGMIDGDTDRGPGMWGWSPAKRAVELLFWSGRVSARRGKNFERWYDLPERVLPPDVLAAPTPAPADARKELLVLAATSHGLGTARDLADYFRLNVVESRHLLADLVEEGRLEAVAVDGWREPAFLSPDARRPRAVTGRALLSPFDSLIWERARTERLFGFRYRVEIYVPKAKRVHGYYVLPFLLDGDLVARVDLKADRQTGRLLVQAAHGEPGIDIERVADELVAELVALGEFLDLGSGLAISGSGDLATDLEASLARLG